MREEGGVGSSITKRLHCAFFIFLLDFNGFRGGPRWRSTDCAAVLLVPKVFFFFFYLVDSGVARFFLGFVGFLLGYTGFQRVFLDFLWFNRTLMGITGFY